MIVCPIDGSRIITDHLLGGEIDRYCVATGHPYLLEREIAERDRFLERVALAGTRAAHPPVWREVG